MEDFCSSIHKIISSTATKMVSKQFFGISCNIPTDVDITVLGSQDSIKDAKRLGLPKSVKLEILDSFDQSTFFKHGLRVGYEIFPVYKFKDLPNCYFKCRSLDHLWNSYPSVLLKCACCGGPHISTKDESCIANPNCTNCSQKHPSYSFSCPVIKYWIKCNSTIHP